MSLSYPNPLAVIQQKTALIQELEIAIYSIEAGLAVLQTNRPYSPKPKYFAFLLMLSTGFERLMKVIICIDGFETNGVFPSQKDIKKKGHKLQELKESTVKLCFSSTYLDRHFAKDDYEFITSNQVVIDMFAVMDDFATKDRYIFLNNVSNPSFGNESPDRRWENLETLVFGKNDYLQNWVNGNEKKVKQEATRLLVIHIEKFIRALTRLFIFGELGDLARTNSGTIWRFMRLEDSELGKQIYEF